MSEAAVSEAPTKKKPRIVAIDWMRGFVMVLMAIDHVSMFFNPGRVAHDSALFHKPGSALPPLQFLTRWITHLCAPTFVFLAGTAIAISTVRRAERGMEARAIDRDLFIRGAIIAGLDLTLMSTLAGKTILQVLYAIGVSMMLMVPLRRLGGRAMLVIGLVVIVGAEAVLGQLWAPSQGNPPLPIALTLAPFFGDTQVIPYPFVPWLGVMMLGWAFGEHVLADRRGKASTPTFKLLLMMAATGLGVFAFVRGLNGYGNMFLLREGSSWVQWLHVSKYPPGLAYVALELGVMSLVLAGLWRLQEVVEPSDRHPILVFGQTALFYYLLHFILLGGTAQATGAKVALPFVFVGALLLIAVLYPICLGYRALKRKHPTSLLRFI